MKKKKVIILGSTGSIGDYTFDILKKDKKNFSIELLSTNKNITKLIKQAKEFNVKKLIIADYKKYVIAKNKYKNLNIKFYNSFNILDELFDKREIFYTMISIIGIDGLYPSIKMIRYSQNIAIVNKESLVCGWSLIKKQLKKYKTNFIPIDSEHFSIFSLLNNKTNIEKIFITASGGPFLNYPRSRLQQVKLNDALNHPNWKMGKKISIDSATMMNKVFEVIEAKNIFNLDYKKISILIHPKSYFHAIVKFDNGMTKIAMHEPSMKIPIHNSIYCDTNKKIKSKPLNIQVLNNPELKIDIKNKFPLTNLLNILPKKTSLYEAALISINDYFVDKFLSKKINFKELNEYIYKYSLNKNFMKYRNLQPKNIKEIYKIRDSVCLKLDTLGI
tara:strand:+ start:2002 stop:3165 length:1164 start_codon:yes stop_codon:yes gene_type:complete